MANGDPKKKKKPKTGDIVKLTPAQKARVKASGKVKYKAKAVVKKKTARPKSGDLVKMTDKQKASFKKREGIDVTITKAGGVRGKGATRQFSTKTVIKKKKK